MLKHKKNLKEVKKKIYNIRNSRKFAYKQLPLNINNLGVLTKTYDRIVTIRVTSNNIYCSLKDIKKKKILLIGSSGKYRIYISRKRLRTNIERVLSAFFRQVKPFLTVNGIVVTLIAPIRLRKKILNSVKKLRIYRLKGDEKTLKRLRPFIIKVEDKKCFNGCRPAKKRRKKRKGFRIFK